MRAGKRMRVEEIRIVWGKGEERGRRGLVGEVKGWVKRQRIMSGRGGGRIEGGG